MASGGFHIKLKIAALEMKRGIENLDFAITRKKLAFMCMKRNMN